MLSKYVDQYSLNKYFNSYILPIFDFDCLVWGRCSASNITRLLNLQQRAVRIILNAKIMTPSDQMFSKIKWLSFPQKLRYHTCIMMYKALNNMAPEYIQNLFLMTSVSHNRNLRSVDSELLKAPFSRTNYCANAFAIKGAQEWNSLPLELRTVATLQWFVSSVKTYFLNNP